LDDLDRRDEGTGGEDGIVLSLALVGNGVYDAVYTVPVNLGEKDQQLSLQIDTGSSDLWVASTSCSTSSCSLTDGHLYDPSGATQTGVDFSIPYLSGSASGPIVWDNVTIGGYTIGYQALAAANDVENEDLATNFNGILGLALPLNSIIASDIPPVTNNTPDGAAWASNLFSITPPSIAPSSRFLSLALSRPGSDAIPAVFGIGRHPSSLVPDPSLVLYSTVVSDQAGTLFWKLSVTAITVYVNGTTEKVQLEASNTGASSPVAVLDSGVSVILTTTNIANGIYGALGISPASDGMYYVPCTTPLNLTITLDDRPEIPLHPLDLTAEPPQTNQAQFWTGLIQTADSQLSNPNYSLGDIILGVPFLRNVYTVMAYTAPHANGSFPAVNGSNLTITPRLGLLSLTNSTIALEEFYTVRVLNQPISGGNSSGGSAGDTPSSPTVSLGGKKLTVGIVILIGIMSFFGFCCVLFFARWFMFRRKYRKAISAGVFQQYGDVFGVKKDSTTEEYMLTKTISSKDEKSSLGRKSEEATLAVGVKNEKIPCDSIDDETNLVVETHGQEGGSGDEEWGSIASGDNVLVQKVNNSYRAEEPDHLHSSSSSPFSPISSQTQRLLTCSDPQSPASLNFDHEALEDLDEFEMVNTSAMAGIGTASRTSKTYLDSSFLREMNMTSADNVHLSFTRTS
jgi:hypothetical protein